MTTTLALAAFAFGVSLLTLFSGFGLGTLLMPAFALFLPVEIAVASTAVVHAANNLFKAGLLGREAERTVLLRFGIPAVLASFLGALLLTMLAGRASLYAWSFFGRPAEVTSLGLVLGLLILGFALFELLPGLRALRAPLGWLPLGGALSGFFGGLSGHQGALRAIFLAPLELTPVRFASTQALLALMVDAARLLVYGSSFFWAAEASAQIPWRLVAIVTLAAFAGALLGKRLLPKVTLASLHLLIGFLLGVVGLALATGIA